MRHPRTITLGLIALLVVAALYTGRFQRDGKASSPHRPTLEARGTEHAQTAVAGTPRLTLDAQRQTGREVTASKLIASVRFQPQSPCVGDEVVIEALLMPAAADAKVFVNGHVGSPHIVTAREVGPQRVRVLARTWGDTYERKEVTFDVRACAHQGLRPHIRAHLLGERDYAFALEPRPSGPVAWEFGDGGRGTGNPVRHRYATRHDRTHSTYLATARYSGTDRVEVSRVSVSHAEPTAIAARTPFPMVESHGPRFVAWDTQNGLNTERRIVNPFAVDIDFKQSELRGFPCDGSAVQVRVLPAGQVLDHTRISREKSERIAWRVPAEAFSSPICQLLVRVIGDAGGRTVTTTLALETGTPDRTIPLDESTRVALEAVVRARGYGGPVTADELALQRIASGE